MKLQNLLGWLAEWKERFSQTLWAIQEKGIQRFLRPMGLAGLLILTVRGLFYSPSAKQLNRLDANLAVSKVSAQYASEYEQLNSRLKDFSLRLIPLREKESWLFNTVLALAREQGVNLDSIKPQTESALDQFIVLKIGLSVQLSYNALGQWLARIENSKTLMRVGQLDVSKMDNPVGINRVDLQISSLVPKSGGSRGKM
ncbi:MAG: type 4a pilus biogenesis protein PilO [Elusimicrobia bacterium]|nr:type 4a pilus biogenesis protein PilO [Elusimicrobiota bacterium]